MHRLLIVASLLGSWALAGGCTTTANFGPCQDSSDESPCAKQLYFPTGIAIDPDGRHLYVSSANADLRYSGGSVMSIDMDRFERAVCGFSGRKGAACAGLDPKAINPNDYVGRKFDPNHPDPTTPSSGCRYSPLDPTIVECDETPFVTDSVKVGNFAGSLIVQDVAYPVDATTGQCPRGTSPLDGCAAACGIVSPAGMPLVNRRIWLPVRGDPSITFVNVSHPKSTLCTNAAGCPAGEFCYNGTCQGLAPTEAGTLQLLCDKPGKGSHVPSSLALPPRDSCSFAGGPSQPCTDPKIDSCAGERITQRDHVEAKPCMVDGDCLAGATCSGPAPPKGKDIGFSGTCIAPPIPPEPFGVGMDEGCLPSQGGAPVAALPPACPGTRPRCPAGSTPYSHLAVTHLAGGELEIINSGAFNPASTAEIAPADPIVLDVRSGFFAADSSGRHGGFSVAPRKLGDAAGYGYWYSTSRVSPVVALFRVAAEGSILPAAGFSVGGATFAGDDMRQFVFQPDGNRGFFLDNHPPALFTIDTRIDPAGMPTNAPRNQVIDATPLCQGPSRLGVRQWMEPGAAGAPGRAVTRAYVICFTTGQMMVIDPDLSVVLDTLTVGRGANDIAFNFGVGDGLEREPAYRRAYVTNYLDMTVSVIDLDRGSPTEDRVIARLGFSTAPVTM